MTITEASKLTLVPLDTLRYYERIGIIPPVARSKSGIRDYTDGNIKWIEFAKCMRAAGLPIEVLIEYLKLYRMGDDTLDTRRALLVEQRDKLTEKLGDMQKTIDRLNLKIERYDTVFIKQKREREEHDKGYFEE